MYILNREHADFVNGKKDILPGTSLWLLLIIWCPPCLSLVIALISGSIAFNRWSLQNDLKNYGKTVSGIFINQKTDSYRRNVTSSFSSGFPVTTWTYRYIVADKTYQGNYRTQGILALRKGELYTEVGDTVDVVYLPDNPQRSLLAIDDEQPIGLMIAVLILVLFTAVWGGTAWKFTGGINNKKRRPQLISGRLVDIYPRSHKQGDDSKVIISYSFHSPRTGKVVENSYTCYPPVPSPLPETGQKMAVAYLNDEENWLL